MRGKAPDRCIYWASSLGLLVSILPLHALEYSLFIKGNPEAWISGADGEIAGAAGKGQIADAFRMSGLPIALEWRVYSTMKGWLNWMPADGSVASAGGRSLEAIQFRFPDGLPEGKRLYGRVHVEGVGWLKTMLIEDSVVLGATAGAWCIDAIQMRYTEGEVGENPEFVKNADADFDRYLPAGAIPAAAPVSHPVQIFPDEPGLARWTWMSGKTPNDFWLIGNGVAHQNKIAGSWKRLDTPEFPAFPPSYRIRYGDNDVMTLTLNWNGTVMTGQNQNGLLTSAARTDGSYQLRPGQRPAFAIEKKLETLIIPGLVFENVPLEDAAKALRAKSIEIDTAESDPTKRGIQFTIRNPNGRKLGKVNWRKWKTSMRYATEQIARFGGAIAVVDEIGVTFIPKEDR